MTDSKPALVLHLVSGGEPLVFTLPPDDVIANQTLHGYMRDGGVQIIRTADDSRVVLNFAHVAAAYLDDLQRSGKVFGLR
ncbi:hypothetical protein GCM10009676_44290 [Prauserella halophila]|uniref:Uncharacterized protein n=1 Tax=Prauserella halophila TaxID=185641 RepID=A0ABN1WJL9_9PSEU|nr:hypothetical protein [Prauserella halophila]MCP2237704.1 hypothetical protein [Prauserella halophila]